MLLRVAGLARIAYAGVAAAGGAARAVSFLNIVILFCTRTAAHNILHALRRVPGVTHAVRRHQQALAQAA